MDMKGFKGDATKSYRTRLQSNFNHVAAQARERKGAGGVEGIQPNDIEQGCKALSI